MLDLADGYDSVFVPESDRELVVWPARSRALVPRRPSGVPPGCPDYVANIASSYETDSNPRMTAANFYINYYMDTVKHSDIEFPVPVSKYNDIYAFGNSIIAPGPCHRQDARSNTACGRRCMCRSSPSHRKHLPFNTRLGGRYSLSEYELHLLDYYRDLELDDQHYARAWYIIVRNES